MLGQVGNLIQFAAQNLCRPACGTCSRKTHYLSLSLFLGLGLHRQRSRGEGRVVETRHPNHFRFLLCTISQTWILPISLVPMKGDMISDHKAKRLAVSALTFSVVRRCLKVA